MNWKPLPVCIDLFSDVLNEIFGLWCFTQFILRFQSQFLECEKELDYKAIMNLFERKKNYGIDMK